jgi:cell shape-determining protein MreD
MLKKIGQIIIFFTLSSVIAICQFSLINALPGFWGQVNLVLVAAIFILFFFDWQSALFYATISGFWLDLMSFEFFGLYLGALFLTCFLAYLILKNLLTNRSFYSFFTLIALATIIYNIIIAVLFYFSFRENSLSLLASSSFYGALFYQVIWSLFLALALFNVANVLTKNFTPFFLVKR